MITPSQPSFARDPIEEVIELVRSAASPLPPVRVEMHEACGRILRESVAAPEDQPAFDRSSMDGFAVGLSDPGPRYRIVDRIRAGDWKPRSLASGEAVQIATGAALPSDSLRVVPKENVSVQGDDLVVTAFPDGRYIRFRGEAARRGQELLRPGTALTPGAVSLLASLGHTQPLVSPRVRVTHWTTGNELVSPCEVPGPGQIRDSNSALVSAFLQPWCSSPIRRHLPEDRGAARSAVSELQGMLTETDLLLISGGASVGTHDFTRELFEGLGFSILLAKTPMRPGKPLIVARRDSLLAFGLPGNPLAHFVGLNLFVRAALNRLTEGPCGVLFETATLAENWSEEPSSRLTLWPARVVRGPAGTQATPLPWTSSGDLTPLATANGLLKLSAYCDSLPRGADLPCFVFHS